ncbi:unnamed protein product, partial [Prorocentrum cordatum]
ENGATVAAVRKPTEIDRGDVLKDTQRFKSGARGAQKNMAESMLRRPMAKLLPSSSGKKGAAKFIDSGDDDGSASDGPSIHSGTDGEAELVEPGRCDGGRAAASHKGSKAPLSPRARASSRSSKPAKDDQAALKQQVENADSVEEALPSIDPGSVPPSIFTVAKRSVKRTLESYLDSCKAGKVTHIAVLQELLEEVRDHTEVKCLGVDSVISSAKVAEHDLQKILDDVSHWALPRDFSAKRDSISLAMAARSKKINLVEDIQTLQTIRAGERKKSHKERRQIRGVKEKAANRMHEKGIPQSIAKVIPPVLVEKEVGVSYSSLGDNGECGDSLNFGEVSTFGVVAKKPDQLSKWHVMLQDQHKAFKSELESSAKGNVDYIKKMKGTVGFGPMKSTFEFKHSADADGSSTHPGDSTTFPLLTFFQKPFSVSFTPQACPFAGAACYVTVGNGIAVALAVPVEVILKKVPKFVLNAGDSLYVPFGTWLVIFGVSEWDDNSKEFAVDEGADELPQGWLHYTMRPVIDCENDPIACTAACSAVAGLMARSMPYHPKTMKALQVPLREWRDKIEAAAAKEGEQAGGEPEKKGDEDGIE